MSVSYKELCEAVKEAMGDYFPHKPFEPPSDNGKYLSFWPFPPLSTSTVFRGADLAEFAKITPRIGWKGWYEEDLLYVLESYIYHFYIGKAEEDASRWLRKRLPLRPHEATRLTPAYKNIGFDRDWGLVTCLWYMGNCNDSLKLSKDEILITLNGKQVGIRGGDIISSWDKNKAFLQERNWKEWVEGRPPILRKESEVTWWYGIWKSAQSLSKEKAEVLEALSLLHFGPYKLTQLRDFFYPAPEEKRREAQELKQISTRSRLRRKISGLRTEIYSVPHPAKLMKKVLVPSTMTAKQFKEIFTYMAEEEESPDPLAIEKTEQILIQTFKLRQRKWI